MSWTRADDAGRAVPLVAVDRLRAEPDGDGGCTVVARVGVDSDHPVMRGHFPGLPLYPGVFVVETLCQAMAAAFGAEVAGLRTLRSLRLTAPVHGGDELTLECEVRPGGPGWVVSAVGRRRDGTVTATVKADFAAAAAVQAGSGGAGADPAVAVSSADAPPLDVAAVQAALPQRYPLLLVDQVISTDPGRSIETVKAVTASEPCFAGIPAGSPLEAYACPVSLLIESFGQSAALLWLGEQAATDTSVLLFVGARNYHVDGAAYPGDVVRHVVHLERVVADTAFATGETWVGGRRIARVGSLMAARRSSDAVGIHETRRIAMSENDRRYAELREIIAEVLEIEPEELTDSGDFAEDYQADSLRAIEILARIDKHFKVEIPQSELPELRNLKTTFEAVARHAGWQG